MIEHIDTGTDSNIDDWYKSKELKNMCKFLFVKREGFETKEENCIEMNSPSYYTYRSSSQIREMIKKGESISLYTNSSIIEYIKENELYK